MDFTTKKPIVQKCIQNKSSNICHTFNVLIINRDTEYFQMVYRVGNGNAVMINQYAQCTENTVMMK